LGDRSFLWGLSGDEIEFWASCDSVPPNWGYGVRLIRLYLILSACLIPEVQSSVEVGRTDAKIAWPLCASLSALLQCTATITQGGVRSQTLWSGTIAFNLCFAPSKSRT